MELWEVVARESIRDLIARYNANGDSGRFDQMMDLFAPDAVMEVQGRMYRGKEQIRTIFTGAKGKFAEIPGFTYLRHSTTSHQIDVISPSAAKARCYFSVIMDHGLDHWGRYVDEFKVVDGRWRFSFRRVTVDPKSGGAG